MKQVEYLVAARTLWDQEAATFDTEPDHGMSDPIVKAAWQQLLTGWLPTNASRVLDIGCGTGSLSVLAAIAGHTVMGIDCSPAMIKQAQAKASAQSLNIDFQLMDAATPSLAPASFDVIICRRLLWALPDPPAALERWKNILTQSGQMILIVGFWMTGAGLKANDIIKMLPNGLSLVERTDLRSQSVLWGKQVNDERYALRLTR
jgi:2-polyprenyl-3-methyl-5-hydroxy-6-metoxy-1,4-benzoquinol methylase